MTDTTRLQLVKFERDLLRMLRDSERGLDPCVPVPWPHYEQIMGSLLRAGMVTDFYWSGQPVTQTTQLVTEAGWAWLLVNCGVGDRLPHGCFSGCDRTPAKPGAHNI